MDKSASFVGDAPPRRSTSSLVTDDARTPLISEEKQKHIKLKIAIRLTADMARAVSKIDQEIRALRR